MAIMTNGVTTLIYKGFLAFRIDAGHTAMAREALRHKHNLSTAGDGGGNLLSPRHGSISLADCTAKRSASESPRASLAPEGGDKSARMRGG
jgi:hypothetical protein